MRKHPLAKCEECSLQGERFVPSAIPQGASLAIVGEAPGYQETVYGQPFVGPSGKLLGELLQRTGIGLQETLRTNVVLCRPPDNEDPDKEAIAACKPRLLEELSGAGVHTVLATGGIAAKTLLASGDGILKLRVGPPKPVPFDSRMRLIATVHPAFVLRSSDAFPFLVTDIQKVRAEVREFEPPVFDVPESVEGALRSLARFLPGQPLAVDIETKVEKDAGFEHASQYDLLCIGLSNGQRTVVLPGELLLVEAVRVRLGSTLQRSRIIAQNGKYDVPALWRFAPDLRLWFDTMLASYALDERGGIHSLDYLAREHLGAPNWKSDIKQYTKGSGDYARIPRDVLHRYNAYDVACTFWLYELLLARLQDHGLRNLHDFLVRASNALMKVEDEGVAINLAYLEQLDRHYTAELSTLEEQLSQWVLNPRSYPQAKAAFAQLGVVTPSTDVSHLSQIRERMEQLIAAGRAVEQARVVDAFAETLLAYRGWHKLRSTYTQGLIKRLHNGRIHTTYKQHATVTGRLSSANPNVQNIPYRSDEGRKIRAAFTAQDEDHVFITSDFAQGELRVITVLAGIEQWEQAFREGRSPLRELAPQLFGPNYTKAQYVRTKNVMYGSLYGMILGRGKQGTIYARDELKMSNDAAYQLQRKLFQLLPEVAEWQEKTRAFVKAGGTLTTYKGRSRHFWYISKDNEKDILNEALAFVPQSTLSDICLTGATNLIERGIKVRILVHDEIVVESRRDQVDATQEAITKAMADSAVEFTDKLPFPIEFSVGHSWEKP